MPNTTKYFIDSFNNHVYVGDTVIYVKGYNLKGKVDEISGGKARVKSTHKTSNRQIGYLSKYINVEYLYKVEN
jgi:uncharacterized Zn ribbon protein